MLPSLVKKDNESIVYFPKTALNSDLEFWQYVKNENFHIPLDNIDDVVLNKVLLAIKDYEQLTKKQIEFAKKNWKKYEKQFINFLETLGLDIDFDSLIITIIPTLFGSRGGYGSTNQNKLENIHVFYRYDCQVWVIAQMIISMIVHFSKFKIKLYDNEKHFIETNDWYIKEMITDFLMQNTKLNKIFHNFVPIKNFNNCECSAKISKLSNNYLSELGFPLNTTFSIEDGMIVNLRTKKNILGLTKHEEIVLKLLINKQSEICSFDEISQVVWGKKYYIDKFSLSYLTKLIHQIRNKLKLNGINHAVIYTQRGSGYILK